MVGINVKEPENECHDPNCPFHGELPVRKGYTPAFQAVQC